MNGVDSKQMQECVYNEGSVCLKQTANFILGLGLLVIEPDNLKVDISVHC